MMAAAYESAPGPDVPGREEMRMGLGEEAYAKLSEGELRAMTRSRYEALLCEKREEEERFNQRCGTVTEAIKHLFYFVVMGGWTVFAVMLVTLHVDKLWPHWRLADEVLCKGVLVRDAVKCVVAEGACAGTALDPGPHLVRANFTVGESALLYMTDDCADGEWDWWMSLRVAANPPTLALLFTPLFMIPPVVYWGTMFVKVLQAVFRCMSYECCGVHLTDRLEDYLGRLAVVPVQLYCMAIWGIALHVVSDELTRVDGLRATTCTAIRGAVEETGNEDWWDVSTPGCGIVRLCGRARAPDRTPCWAAPDCSSADEEPEKWGDREAQVAYAVAIALNGILLLLTVLRWVKEVRALRGGDDTATAGEGGCLVEVEVTPPNPTPVPAYSSLIPVGAAPPYATPLAATGTPDPRAGGLPPSPAAGAHPLRTPGSGYGRLNNSRDLAHLHAAPAGTPINRSFDGGPHSFGRGGGLLGVPNSPPGPRPGLRPGSAVMSV